jgi:glycosyltransferase involved in cell wall biosynthesis
LHVLLLTNYFPPEVGAASYLYHDLAETLAERGHRVSVVTGFPRYRVGSTRARGFFRIEQLGSSRVVRVASSSLDRGGPMRRGLDHLYLAPSLFAGGLVAGRPNIILAYSPPLTLAAAAWALANVWRVPYVLNVQDLFPQYAVDVGLLRSRVVVRAFEALERFAYRTADAVIVNSDGSRAHVLGRKGSPARTHVVPNWVDVGLIRPGRRTNALRRMLGLPGHFVVLHAGTIGYQQDLDTVIEAAEILRGDEDICFLFVGEGVERERLEQAVQTRGLANARFAQFQPREDYARLLQAADVCVVTLKKEVRTPAVPSKLLGIMAAGRPVIVSADPSGDAPALVSDVSCGLCVPPGRPAAFADAVRLLKSNPSLARKMGRRARRHAERHFSREACVAQYEELFARLVERRT